VTTGESWEQSRREYIAKAAVFYDRRFFLALTLIV